MLLYEITDAFKRARIPFAVVGGYALALQGIIRATVDVDLVLSLSRKSLADAEKCLKDLGFTSRLPITAREVFDFREEYIAKRNLLAWSFVDYSNPLRQVDILLTTNLKDIKSKSMKVGGRTIMVATLESLLKMKLAAGRPQDKADILRIKEKLHEQNKKNNP